MENKKINNADYLFDDNIKPKDLAKKSISGGLVTLGATAIIFAVDMGKTVVLARLLTPEDFGIIGMAMIFIGFIGIFKDSGLSMATVQRKTINKMQISTLFWINVLISFGLALLILFSAPFVALFFGREELKLVTAALADSFFIGGISIQHQALLHRHMRFWLKAQISIIQKIVSVFTMILLAFLGWSYWSLVAGYIVGAVAGTFLIFFYVPWLPGRPKRGTGIRQMLSFGLNLTSFSFFNYFSTKADNLLIGRIIGADALGLYQKSYNLFMLPVNQISQPISKIGVPALSSLQTDPDKFRNYYYRIIRLIAIAVFPISTIFILETEFIVLFLLGEQWTETVPVIRILAIAGLISPIAKTRGLVMISYGLARRYFYWGLIYSILTVAGFSIGVFFGIEGVAWSYVIITYAVLVPSLYYVFHKTPVTPVMFLRQSIAPAVTTAIAAVVLIVSRNIFPSDSLGHFTISCTLFIAVYVLLCWSRKGFREDIKPIVSEMNLSRKIK